MPIKFIPKRIKRLGNLVIPIDRLKDLVAKEDDHLWEAFRDGLVGKWQNLNIVCGLVLSSMSTIMFANIKLNNSSFAFGIVSLLSSLISIAFGTAFIYILGDTPGKTLQEIGKIYSTLFLYALFIPQLWASVCFVTFFLCTGIFAWDTAAKGLAAKGVTLVTAVLIVAHVIAFALLCYPLSDTDNDNNNDDSEIKHNIRLVLQLSAEPGQDVCKISSEPLRFTTEKGITGVIHFSNPPPESISQNKNSGAQVDTV